MDYIDHISLEYIKDKKILLALTKGKTKWQLPGGKKEENETDDQTLIRECKEELNVDLDFESIKLVDTIQGQASHKVDGVIVRVKIYTAEFEGSPNPQAEIEKADYFSFNDVPDTSELGWEYLRKLVSEGKID